MNSLREEARLAIEATIRARLEDAFRPLDDIVRATAPDTPPSIIAAWEIVRGLMTPDYLARRDALLGKAATQGAEPKP